LEYGHKTIEGNAQRNGNGQEVEFGNLKVPKRFGLVFLNLLIPLDLIQTFKYIGWLLEPLQHSKNYNKYVKNKTFLMVNPWRIPQMTSISPFLKDTMKL
jgi:hypothetical protein